MHFLKLLVHTLLPFLAYVIPLLLAVAYFTLYERQILAALQRRQGPNIVGFYGLFQPLADGLKLFIKESIMYDLFTLWQSQKTEEAKLLPAFYGQAKLN